jgi:hypothetical protein
MNCHAKLVTESNDAHAVAQALNADNVALEYLNVTTAASGNAVVSEIRAQSLTTLMATVDDLLSCQITSESLIKNG